VTGASYATGTRERRPANGCILFYRTRGRRLEGGELRTRNVKPAGVSETQAKKKRPEGRFDKPVPAPTWAHGIGEGD